MEHGSAYMQVDSKKGRLEYNKNHLRHNSHRHIGPLYTDPNLPYTISLKELGAGV